METNKLSTSGPMNSSLCFIHNSDTAISYKQIKNSANVLWKEMGSTTADDRKTIVNYNFFFDWIQR